MEKARPTGTVTFLFTDIEGSTDLWDRHPEAMRAALAQHDVLLADIIEQHKGTVFKTVGDAFYCAFNLPEEALAAAVAAQRAIASYTWGAGIGRLGVRMAVHSGSATERDGDYFGAAVNCVARLTALACGEQILVSSSTALLLADNGVELRNLGRYHLKGFSQPQTIYQVIADDLRHDFPPLASVGLPANNLPSQISSFVGRSVELQDLRRMLSERFVTITGPGGMGKTRIALQLAREVLAEFPDGAWLVELAKVHDPALILQTIAAALNVRESPQQALEETLLQYLTSKHVMIILDNSEHVIEGIVPFVKALLARCPKVTLVITSREALHVIGERVFRLSPLSYAAEDAQIGNLKRYDSTRLFLERARAFRPELPAGREDAREIASICRKLEGIPLAIELAAARVTTLSLPHLNERLAKKLSPLISRDSSEDERHRTLKGTIDWSYQLLDKDQRRFFATLCVFKDTFTYEACQKVCAQGDEDTLDLLESLVEKSFVSIRQIRNGSRYQLLDIVREYANEKLESAARATALRSHFEYYESFAATDRADAGAKAQWLDEMEINSPNIRLALGYGLDERLPQTATFLSNVGHYWQIRGHITEARTWLSRFLEQEDAFSAESVALVLRRAGIFASIQDDYDHAIGFSERARELYSSLNNQMGQAEALHAIAVIEHRQGDSTAARNHYAEAADFFRKGAHLRGLAVALVNLAVVSLGYGDLEQAWAYLAESSLTAQKLNDPDISSTVLSYQGLWALRSGKLRTANDALTKALSMKLRLEDAFGIIEVENRLASVRLAQGKVLEARRLLRTSLRKALKIEAHNLVIDSYERLAEVFWREKNYEQADHSIEMASHLRQKYCYRHASEVDLLPIRTALRAKITQRTAGVP